MRWTSLLLVAVAGVALVVSSAAASEEEAGLSQRSTLADRLHRIQARRLKEVVSATVQLSAHDGFNPGEHWTIGNDAWALFRARNKHMLLTQLDQGLSFQNAKLQYGQIVALTGDFVGMDVPISNGFKATCPELTAETAANLSPDIAQPASHVFDQIRGKLWHDLSTKEAEKMLQWASREKKAIREEILDGASDASSEAFEKVNNLKSMITDAWIQSRLFNGNFMTVANAIRLAGQNVDHFVPCSKLAYAIGHHLALKYATLGNVGALHIAFAYEAMAHHFYTDHFSAGHLRTPRAAASNQCRWAGALAAKSMHDEDNVFGLHVKNARGDKWVAFGDRKMADARNRRSRQIMLDGMQSGLQEVWEAFKTHKYDLKSYEPFTFLPVVDNGDGGGTPNFNHAPLLMETPDHKLMVRQKERSKEGHPQYHTIHTRLKCPTLVKTHFRVQKEIKNDKMEDGSTPKLSVVGSDYKAKYPDPRDWIRNPSPAPEILRPEATTDAGKRMRDIAAQSRDKVDEQLMAKVAANDQQPAKSAANDQPAKSAAPGTDAARPPATTEAGKRMREIAAQSRKLTFTKFDQ